MPLFPSEELITECLRLAYRPGTIASTDGYASMYEGVQLKCAAILLPLLRKNDEWQLLFTHRTETVEQHKGQVSFPGGGCNQGETTPEATALREAQEEIGLSPAKVRLLGRLNDVLTITRYRITPVIGVIPFPYEFRLEAAEVERAFAIPLAWLARRENWVEQPMTPDGKQRSFPVIVYHPYEGEILWGASARITQNFLNVLGLLK